MAAACFQQVRIALREFGVTRCRLTQLASRHNDVFRVDAASGERWVLRIQNDLMSDTQARSQLQWLAALAEQTDVIVPTPLHTVDGRALAAVEWNGKRRRAVVLRWIVGKPARQRTEKIERAAIQMIARLHRHAETFRQPAGFACRRLEGDWLFGGRFFALAANAGRHLSRSHRKIAATAETFVRDAMKILGYRKKRFGVIHADLNLGNILFHRGAPSPIDFDEWGKGWYLFDLAELIRTSITPENWAERKRFAIEAYKDHRRLDDAECEAFDAFIIATFVQYLNWAFIHARNRDDLKWVGFCMDVLGAISG